MTTDFMQKTKALIDDLKGICASYGLGNDGNEFKIITQVFLYKFLNDKFTYELKQLAPELQHTEYWEKAIEAYSDDDYQMLLFQLPAGTAKLKRNHMLSSLFKKQNEADYANTFDDTLRDIAILNNDIFSVKTGTGSKITLFDELSQYISDSSQRNDFCKALINKLIPFSFEHIFGQKFDFFATIFEYLIKDYNKDSGGKYAEYYTPHAVAKIMAAILVDEPVQDVTCYDPSAGSGTLLMNIAHAIGEDRCSIYSQDISQKSTGMLRLNLILNNLVHSIQNIIQGNTMLAPYHKEESGRLKRFDFIVSNPPFKLDFSDSRDSLDSKENHVRFFAGVPKVPKSKKDSMAIYLLFLQHIMHSLTEHGRAAIAVPTGFITAQSSIERKIREQLVERKMLRGVVSMPSNIFATTGTNVSILFLDNANKRGNIVLMDASKLGTTIKEGKNQKTFLSDEEENRIIKTFNQHQAVEGLSVVVSYDDIKDKNYSLSAGQYFEVKIDYEDITQEQFDANLDEYKKHLNILFAQSNVLEKTIQMEISRLSYE